MGFSKSCALLGALVLISCGSPAELDEDTFPSLNETGYAASGSSPSGGSAGSGTQSVVPGAAGSGSVGAAGSGSVGAAGSGGSSMMMAGGGGCPSDVTTLFARPASQGGCTGGGGCHEPTSATKPDLISPGVASRLLNMPSRCSTTASGMSVQPRPYIGATDSFLEEKLVGPVAANCGFTMPLLMDYALSASDRQCILNWIDQVAAGGG